MPSRKRTVKYNENTDVATGDKNVEVSEEQSVDTDTKDESLVEQDDERYSSSSG